MFNAESEKKVNEVILSEWKTATDNYGYNYKNGVESAAILLEEIEEAKRELNEVNNMYYMWLGNSEELQSKSGMLDAIVAAAKNTMLECAQVCAVVQKIKQGYES